VFYFLLLSLLPQADCGPDGCLTEQEALPWFLQFTQGYEQPRPDLGGADTRHMLCRLVEQRRVSQKEGEGAQPASYV
jgi:hypothetical protein